MSNQHQEHPSTYFVQDRSSQEELNRLHIQDQMVTASMGGALPEQADPAVFKQVLDVGCGTGDWIIETATTYPTIQMLIGVDISAKMLNYARAQAEAQKISDRVEFHVMDALHGLEFPNVFFDLVNHRLGISYLRTWDWPDLLQEYRRVCKPEGVIRITEAEPFAASNSPALTQLCMLLLQALHQAGHLFTPDTDGLTSHLADTLERYGLTNVQKRVHSLEYRAGTPEGQSFYENEKAFFRTIIPFLRKWTQIPHDYETIYSHAVNEMQRPDFVATWNLLTVWGNAPGYGAVQNVIP